MDIRVENLQFGWQRSKVDLAINDLHIKSQEHLFLYGASGSGKSTLLNLITGIITPQKGRICLGETQLNLLSAAKRDAFRSENIGFIFQSLNLLPYLSVLDNVMLACDFSRLRKTRAIQRHTSVESAARHCLDSLSLSSDLFYRKASALSVGQQQRVAIARALIGSPPIVIADEPTSALDQTNRDEFMTLLLNVVTKEGGTLVFVSHDMTLSEAFTHKLLISELNSAEHLCY